MRALELILVYLGTRWGSLVSFGSIGRALVVVGFIQVRLVHSGAPLGSLGSYAFVSFKRAQPGSRWVHSGSLGSFRRSLVVIGFICIRLVNWGSFGSFRRVPGVVGLIRVHSHSFRSFGRVQGLVLFIWVRLWIHSVSFGSLRRALGVDGFI